MIINQIEYKNKEGEIITGNFIEVKRGYVEIRIFKEPITFKNIISKKEVKINPITGRVE